MAVRSVKEPESMLEAVNLSVTEAVKTGKLDRKKHAAVIRALRLLAQTADEGRPNDNVTLPTMLKFLTTLNLVPAPEVVDKKPAVKVSSLDEMRAKLKVHSHA